MAVAIGDGSRTRSAIPIRRIQGADKRKAILLGVCVSPLIHFVDGLGAMPCEFSDEHGRASCLYCGDSTPHERSYFAAVLATGKLEICCLELTGDAAHRMPRGDESRGMTFELWRSGKSVAVRRDDNSAGFWQTTKANLPPAFDVLAALEFWWRRSGWRAFEERQLKQPTATPAADSEPAILKMFKVG